VIPDSVTSIDIAAFSGCSGLTGDVVIPEGVTEILSSTFNSCRGLNGKLVIPEGVTTIERLAFYYCSSIREMQFNGSTVPYLYSDTFLYMAALETVWVPADALDAYTEALTGRVPEETVIRAMAAEVEPGLPSEPPAVDSNGLDWFFDRLKEGDSYLWATAAYYRIMNSLEN